jgi:hypothetical protein
MRTRYSGAAILVAASMLAALRVSAQEPSRGLKLQIDTERPSYSLGEPVYLAARLVNQGPDELRFMTLLNPKDGYLTISIRDPAGRGVGFVPLSSRDRDTPPATLAPKAEIGATFPVSFGASGWVFQIAGRFVAQARFEVRTGPGEPLVIRSNPLEIAIRDEPGGARFPMEGPEGLEAGRFLTWRGGDQLERGLARLSQFAERYPTSPVVDHYRVALGRSFSRPFKNYQKGAVRPADYARALEELGRARDEVLPTSVRVEKYLAQATCFLGTDRRAEAAELLRQARTLIGERVELADFREQLERLERAAGQKQ